jgi:hypothetical protein
MLSPILQAGKRNGSAKNKSAANGKQQQPEADTDIDMELSDDDAHGRAY